MVWHTGVAGLYAVMQKNKGEFVKYEGLFLVSELLQTKVYRRCYFADLTVFALTPNCLADEPTFLGRTPRCGLSRTLFMSIVVKAAPVTLVPWEFYHE